MDPRESELMCVVLPLSFFSSSSSTFCVALLTELNTLASSYAALLHVASGPFNSLCMQHSSFTHSPRPFLPCPPHILFQVGVETSQQPMFARFSDTVRSVDGVITKRTPEECRFLIVMNVEHFQPLHIAASQMSRRAHNRDGKYIIMLQFCTIYSQNAFFSLVLP
jgi:hypothetical protein